MPARSFCVRLVVTAGLILVTTSSVFAAERPQPPASFAPVADAVKTAVFSVVLPRDDADDGVGDEEWSSFRIAER